MRGVGGEPRDLPAHQKGPQSANDQDTLRSAARSDGRTPCGLWVQQTTSHAADGTPRPVASIWPAKMSSQKQRAPTKRTATTAKDDKSPTLNSGRELAEGHPPQRVPNKRGNHSTASKVVKRATAKATAQRAHHMRTSKGGQNIGKEMGFKKDNQTSSKKTPHNSNRNAVQRVPWSI